MVPFFCSTLTFFDEGDGCGVGLDESPAKVISPRRSDHANRRANIEDAASSHQVPVFSRILLFVQYRAMRFSKGLEVVIQMQLKNDNVQETEMKPGSRSSVNAGRGVNPNISVQSSNVSGV